MRTHKSCFFLNRIYWLVFLFLSSKIMNIFYNTVRWPFSPLYLQKLQMMLGSLLSDLSNKHFRKGHLSQRSPHRLTPCGDAGMLWQLGCHFHCYVTILMEQAFSGQKSHMWFPCIQGNQGQFTSNLLLLYQKNRKDSFGWPLWGSPLTARAEAASPHSGANISKIYL